MREETKYSTGMKSKKMNLVTEYVISAVTCQALQTLNLRVVVVNYAYTLH